ncbi:hypothetical protein BFN01_03540 [Microbacterium sp. AR7-10]|uniref:GGDEF domain-containing protein, diguanylate cyclase (C-di-GMP synthetase) or its enzymatically inactive variants n=2 Tax=Microbacteriaceae TaxID=85023 RepID=A0ABR8W6Z0_9MICO|nr:hypothetical protein [Microbacterium commune]OIU88764.1 hypothetical protein BFN01_03540 [Microbacterium sp. AR7-10]
MTRTVRSMTTALALGFAVYFAARGIGWVDQPSNPLLMIAGILLFLAAMLVAVLAGASHSVRMPLGATLLATVAAAGVPSLVSLSLEASMRGAPFATWYIGATGLLGVVCVVRRRFFFGWLILGILALSTWAYMGLDRALTLGLVGSITWVVVAQVLVLFWNRAIRDTERLTDVQRGVSAWHASQLVRQRERRVRTQRALVIAGPVLSRTVATRGEITEQERLEARLAEGTLRDELRGASLINDAVRSMIKDARRRGSVVSVFDEGGLEGIDEERAGQIRDELAAVLASAHSDRVIIRAGRDDTNAVTVVGRSADGESEDAVDLWHEIRRVAE